MLERQRKEKLEEEPEAGTYEVDEQGIPINCEFKVIEEYHLDKNEFAPNFIPKTQGYEPVPTSVPDRDSDTEDESDEDFSWYKTKEHMDESYFCLVNC